MRIQRREEPVGEAEGGTEQLHSAQWKSRGRFFMWSARRIDVATAASFPTAFAVRSAATYERYRREPVKVTSASDQAWSNFSLAALASSVLP